jgi:hypothetical protein
VPPPSPVDGGRGARRGSGLSGDFRVAPPAPVDRSCGDCGPGLLRAFKVAPPVPVDGSCGTCSLRLSPEFGTTSPALAHVPLTPRELPPPTISCEAFPLAFFLLFAFWDTEAAGEAEWLEGLARGRREPECARVLLDEAAG